MKTILCIVIVALVGLSSIGISESVKRNRELAEQIEAAKDDPRLIVLGTNNNSEISESSGLAYGTFVGDSIWTHNDSGHAAHLFLMRTNGELLGRVQLRGVKNIDWEAMAGFQMDGKPLLAVADVGDNDSRRKSCQIYVLPEPRITVRDATEGPIQPTQKVLDAARIEFEYSDGPRDCEAIGVDVNSKQIWLVEKVFYNQPRAKVPGIYVLPLTTKPTDRALVAKRIADFPIRSVTGMAFSPNNKRLIIRNYLNAHLYTRGEEETWEEVVSKSKPIAVSMPLQRQGEAICFSPDSKAVILTSEVKGQPIWKVRLETGKKAKDRPGPAPAESGHDDGSASK